MGSGGDNQKPEMRAGRAALDGVPTFCLEAGVQLSLEVIASREGISKREVLERIISRLDEPFHSSALDALMGVSGKRPV